MRLLAYFLPTCPRALVYMLQRVEYNSPAFLRWLSKLPKLSLVARRGQLDLTARARLLLVVGQIVFFLILAVSLSMVLFYSWLVGLVLLVFLPVLLAIKLAVFNSLLGLLVVGPAEKREIGAAKSKLGLFQARRVAVLGSYGKTTMKDLLATVLSAGLKARATPGNKNVLISHARWVNNDLVGDEQVLIFEYGEGEPGDITRLAELSKPHIAFITGLAPAHLDRYGSLDAVMTDLNAIFDVADIQSVYWNQESPELTKRVSRGLPYSKDGVAGWKVQLVDSGLDGIRFSMESGEHKLHLHSQLLGQHQLGPLAAVVAVALNLGLTPEQVKAGVAATKPFTHRMQPYGLNGATIIDDTYNGNLEGVRAGLALLANLKANGRKVYVTPGLVEQGVLTESVHKEIGALIAEAAPDLVVLMQNSTTALIQNGLESKNFTGKVQVETHPLDFYKGLEHFVAAGDVVLMQNDWPDNYS